MERKTLIIWIMLGIIVVILAPMLGVISLMATKAEACPKPNEFREGYALQRNGADEIEVPAYFTGLSDDNADFMLREKPVRFSSAMLMSSKIEENPTEAKGRLYSCEYYVEGESKPKLALSQAKKYKSASIALNPSSFWERHPRVKKRYECSSNNVEDCPFTLKK